MTPLVSVVIVNFNGADFILDCLDALFASKIDGEMEVVFVDNASTDDSLTVVTPYLNRMIMIRNRSNMGFSYANNQAIRLAEGRYIFLLNTDAVVQPDVLYEMIKYHDVHSTIGMMAPKLVNADGTLQCPGNWMGHWRFKQDRCRNVPFIAGAAVLIERSKMITMGLMDENLFFYNDDVDMSWFCRIHDLPIVYFPSVKVTHHGGLSSRFRQVGSLIEGYRGGMYLARKHYGKLAHFLYRIIVMIDLLVNVLRCSILSLWRSEERLRLGGYVVLMRIAVTNDYYLDREKVKRGVIDPWEVRYG